MPNFKRLEVDKNITNDLGQYIEITMKKWYNLIEKRPVTLEEFRSYSIPKGDVDNVGNSVHVIGDGTEEHICRVKNKLGADETTNVAYYSPMSMMFWHTNSSHLGKRLYYSFSMDKALFAYKDNETGEIVEDWDDEGWTARSFDITKDLFWHSVWTSGRRFSFGFNFRPQS